MSRGISRCAQQAPRVAGRARMAMARMKHARPAVTSALRMRCVRRRRARNHAWQGALASAGPRRCSRCLSCAPSRPARPGPAAPPAGAPCAAAACARAGKPQLAGTSKRRERAAPGAHGARSRRVRASYTPSSMASCSGVTPRCAVRRGSVSAALRAALAHKTAPAAPAAASAARARRAASARCPAGCPSRRHAARSGHKWPLPALLLRQRPRRGRARAAWPPGAARCCSCWRCCWRWRRRGACAARAAGGKSAAGVRSR
jgi:hypothetical protein